MLSRGGTRVTQHLGWEGRWEASWARCPTGPPKPRRVVYKGCFAQARLPFSCWKGPSANLQVPWKQRRGGLGFSHTPRFTSGPVVTQLGHFIHNTGKREVRVSGPAWPSMLPRHNPRHKENGVREGRWLHGSQPHHWKQRPYSVCESLSASLLLHFRRVPLSWAWSATKTAH